MRLDNFIVRPKRRHVEKFQEQGAWDALSAGDRDELIEHVAGLPSELADDELEARQFDYLILQAQLAALTGDAAPTGFQERIIKIAGLLEELGNVPMVAAEMALILEVQTGDFWQDITAPILENVRRRLRRLVRLIEPASRKIVYTNFTDEIGEGIGVDLENVGVGTDMARFKMKVRHFLEAHADHITLQKLKRDEQLTPQDVSELERIFREEGIAEDDDLARLREEGGVGLFIRSLIGLDREASKRALDGFIQGRTLTANQIEFINLIIDYLTDRGVIDPRVLYESPFTDFDDQGVSGIFPASDVKNLVNILKAVSSRAAA
jgi:type I restriction enzyme R subunit